MTRAIRAAVVLLATLIPRESAVSAQRDACTQPLATPTVAERSYASIDVGEFEGRVFLYAPDIRASRGAFDPFDLWIIEGIYGRPFVQSSGGLDAAAFERLKKTSNVRATPLTIRRATETTRVLITRQNYVLDVSVRVSATGADSVAARICRR